MTPFNFFKKIPPLPLPISFQKRCPSPLGQCLNESYLYFRWLPGIESCWGQGISWTKRKSGGLGLIMPLTEGLDDLVMYCFQSLAQYGGCFWKEKEWGPGYFLLLKNSKMVAETQFFSWWELLPNMPGMQSLKVLLLFVKEQCRFLTPLNHLWSCVLIPLWNFWVFILFYLMFFKGTKSNTRCYSNY